MLRVHLHPPSYPPPPQWGGGAWTWTQTNSTVMHLVYLFECEEVAYCSFKRLFVIFWNTLLLWWVHFHIEKLSQQMFGFVWFLLKLLVNHRASWAACEPQVCFWRWLQLLMWPRFSDIWRKWMEPNESAAANHRSLWASWPFYNAQLSATCQSHLVTMVRPTSPTYFLTERNIWNEVLLVPCSMLLPVCVDEGGRVWQECVSFFVSCSLLWTLYWYLDVVH